MISSSFTQTITIGQKPPTFGSYLPVFICELSYGFNPETNTPYTRPETFFLDKNTQPGTILVVNGQFIKVIEKL